jgi:hypothetical protein
LVLNQYANIGRTGIGDELSNVGQGEIDYWVDQLASGAITPDNLEPSFVNVIADFVTSNPENEYSQYVSSYLQENDPRFQGIAQLYEETLGREADPQGLVSWYSQFGTEISDEERTAFLQTAAPERVQNLYESILGREGTSEEIQAWVDAGVDPYRLEETFKEAAAPEVRRNSLPTVVSGIIEDNMVTAAEAFDLKKLANEFGFSLDDIVKLSGVDKSIVEQIIGKADTSIGDVIKTAQTAFASGDQAGVKNNTGYLINLLDTGVVSYKDLADQSGGVWTEQGVKDYVEPLRTFSSDFAAISDNPNLTSDEIRSFLNKYDMVIRNREDGTGQDLVDKDSGAVISSNGSNDGKFSLDIYRTGNFLKRTTKYLGIQMVTDANGNSVAVPYTHEQEGGSLGQVLAVAAIIPGPHQPFAQAANAIYALDQGNYIGAILSSLSAASSFGAQTGTQINALSQAGEIEAATNLANTFGGTLAANLDGIRTASTVVSGLNAIDKENWAGVFAAASNLYKTYGDKSVEGALSGATGVSEKDIDTGIKLANVGFAINANDGAGMLYALGELTSSADLKIAGSAKRTIDALQSGDPVRIVAAVQGLNKTITANADQSEIIKAAKASDNKELTNVVKDVNVADVGNVENIGDGDIIKDLVDSGLVTNKDIEGDFDRAGEGVLVAGAGSDVVTDAGPGGKADEFSSSKQLIAESLPAAMVLDPNGVRQNDDGTYTIYDLDNKRALNFSTDGAFMGTSWLVNLPDGTTNPDTKNFLNAFDASEYASTFSEGYGVGEDKSDTKTEVPTGETQTGTKTDAKTETGGNFWDFIGVDQGSISGSDASLSNDEIMGLIGYGESANPPKDTSGQVIFGDVSGTFGSGLPGGFDLIAEDANVQVFENSGFALVVRADGSSFIVNKDAQNAEPLWIDLGDAKELITKPTDSGTKEVTGGDTKEVTGGDTKEVTGGDTKEVTGGDGRRWRRWRRWRWRWRWRWRYWRWR